MERTATLPVLCDEEIHLRGDVVEAPSQTRQLGSHRVVVVDTHQERLGVAAHKWNLKGNVKAFSIRHFN